MPPMGAMPPPMVPPAPPRPPMAGPMGGAPGAGAGPMLAGAPGGIPPGIMPPRKRGGKVSHPDEAEDRAMIKNMIKPSALKRAHGGKVHHMTAGAGSGDGRLEKIGKKAKDAGQPQTV